MMPRQSWTDERLDHFEKRVDERFDRVDERFKQVDERFDHFERRVDERFDQMDKWVDLMNADIRELRQAMNQLNRTMSIGFVSLAVLIASAVVFF